MEMTDVANISARMRTILELNTSATTRYKATEEVTGINRNTWKTWWSKDDPRTSGELIKSVARAFPQHAFGSLPEWLILAMVTLHHGASKRLK